MTTLMTPQNINIEQDLTVSYTEEELLDLDVPLQFNIDESSNSTDLSELLVPIDIDARSSIVETRLYQQRVIDNTMKAIREGHKSILITLPTGAGKSIIGHLLAKRLIEEYGYSVGWTCMRRILLKQAELENRAKFNVPITYFSTFTHHLPKIDVVIEDEAQHSASNTSTSINSQICPKVHIAMTATPYRTDHMKLCFSKVIIDAGLRQLVDEGWLSPYHLYITNMDWSPKTVASIYLQDPNRWGKSIAFFQTRAQCYDFMSILEAAGHASDVVIGGSVKKQEEKIARFRRGEVNILSNVFVLTEGFDAPELRTVFVRDSAKGPTTQMAGRAFRKHPSKPYAQIVQSDKSPNIFSNIVSPERKFTVDEKDHTKWFEREGHSKLMELVERSSLAALSQAPEVKMPPFILKNKYKQLRRRRVEERLPEPATELPRPNPTPPTPPSPNAQP